jgi:signal transduction histidine kinase
MIECATTKRPIEDPHEDEGLRMLNLNHFMQEIMQVLRRVVRNRVRLDAVLPNEEVRVMADRERMRQVFASIVAYGSEIIRKGGTITISAKSLPIKSDLVEKGGGCALLSVISADVAAKRPAIVRKSGRSVFREIRSIIAKHNGSVRILRHQGMAHFNIYLPVLQPI